MTVSAAFTLRHAAVGAAMTVALVAGGCSGDNGAGFFSTGSLAEAPQPVAAKPSVDPVCVTMAAQIDKLRQGGTIDRLEKVADGRTPDVTVKRASIATQAQLNRANADFIAKCGPAIPKSAVTAAVPAAPVAAPIKAVVKTAQAAAAPKAATPAAPSGAGTSGVTIAPPAAPQ